MKSKRFFCLGLRGERKVRQLLLTETRVFINLRHSRKNLFRFVQLNPMNKWVLLRDFSLFCFVVYHGPLAKRLNELLSRARLTAKWNYENMENSLSIKHIFEQVKEEKSFELMAREIMMGEKTRWIIKRIAERKFYSYRFQAYWVYVNVILPRRNVNKPQKSSVIILLSHAQPLTSNLTRSSR